MNGGRGTETWVKRLPRLAIWCLPPCIGNCIHFGPTFSAEVTCLQSSTSASCLPQQAGEKKKKWSTNGLNVNMPAMPPSKPTIWHNVTGRRQLRHSYQANYPTPHTGVSSAFKTVGHFCYDTGACLPVYSQNTHTQRNTKTAICMAL